MITEFSRLRLKRATIPGVTPTIPTGSTIDNSWIPTDLMVGEMFLNSADDRLWVRTASGNKEISISGISSENFYTESAFILSGNTLGFNRTNSTGSTLAYTVDLTPIVGGGSFTGNTSGTCISDIYVENIYGCSELTLHTPIQHNGCTASGTLSTAFGNGVEAINLYSHAQGSLTTASGFASHAQGESTVASGNNSHAQGGGTIASGDGSHAGGSLTTASGYASHSGGRGGGPSSRVIATGDASFAHFRNTSGSYKGAMADQSAILGGLNHNIEVNANQSAILGGSGNIISNGVTNSVILGGSGITGTTSNTAYMENSVNTGVHQFGEYTVSTVPLASSYPGGMIAVTDEAGGYTMAFSDGTDWRRMQDRVVIS